MKIQNETFKSEMYQLGAEIVFAMNAESLEQGASFALITKMDQLHQSALNHGVRSINVSTALSNSTFDLRSSR